MGLSEDLQLGSSGTELRLGSAGSLAKRLCAVPVVFSLFVFFKHRAHFFFFQTEAELF